MGPSGGPAGAKNRTQSVPEAFECASGGLLKTIAKNTLNPAPCSLLSTPSSGCPGCFASLNIAVWENSPYSSTEMDLIANPVEYESFSGEANDIDGCYPGL